MRSFIKAGLAGALALCVSGMGAQAQLDKRDFFTQDGRYDPRAEQQFERRGGGGERLERRERVDQAQRFDREERRERFDRGDRFDRGYGGSRSVIVRERYREPVVVERRIVRPPRARTVCTTRIRERVTPGGVVIRRPVEVCRQVFGSL